MAATTVGGRYVPEGVNRGNEDFIEATAPAMAAADTLTVLVPDGADQTLLPLFVAAINKQVSPMVIESANIALTSFTPGTGPANPGQIILTASGAIPAGTTVVVRRLGA